jgi:hypothetical protein
VPDGLRSVVGKSEEKRTLGDNRTVSSATPLILVWLQVRVLPGPPPTISKREISPNTEKSAALAAFRVGVVSLMGLPEALRPFRRRFLRPRNPVSRKQRRGCGDGFDAAFGLGSTDAVKGNVGDWAGLIVTFYFGKRGIENVVRIMKR